MKILLTKLALIITVPLISCSNEMSVDISMLQINNGLFYLGTTDHLFSGTAVSYYEDGQQKSEQHVVNGNITGKNIFYDEDGTIKLEVYITDSFLNGDFYSRDDDDIFSAIFDRGVLVQREIQYQLADITIIQNYANNVLTTRELDLAGELIATTEVPFTDNNMATVAIEADMLVVSFTEGQQLTGRLFYRDGDIIFQENYVNGLLNILLYHDQANGNIIYHCYYEGARLEASSDEICTSLPVNRSQ